MISKCRNDRRGFTLVELMLGIAILALVATPILMMFTSADRMAARGSDLGDATLAAENMAEQFESADLSAWVSEGDIPQIDGGTDILTGSYVQRSEGADGIVSYAKIAAKPLNGPYYMSYEGVESGYSEYNAVVTIDAGDGGDSPLPSDDSGYYALNSEDLSQYMSMDHVYAQSQGDINDHDERAWEAFEQDLTISAATVEGFVLPASRDAVTATRKVTITLSYGTGSNFTATIFFAYAFSYSSNGETVTSTYVSQREYITPTLGVEVHWSEPFPSVYVLLYPWYYDGGDEIEILDNRYSTNPMNIVLGKQRDENVDLRAAELSYEGASIVLKTINTNFAPTLISNFDEGLDPNVIKTYTTSYDISNLNGTQNVDGEFASGDELVLLESKERIFDIRIELFERNSDGTSNYAEGPVNVLTMTKLQ